MRDKADRRQREFSDILGRVELRISLKREKYICSDRERRKGKTKRKGYFSRRVIRSLDATLALESRYIRSTTTTVFGPESLKVLS